MLLGTILVHKYFISLIKSHVKFNFSLSHYLNFGGKKMIKSFFKFSAVLSLLLTSTVSLAQVALEEMVVTSQKREQNLLDVPSALQAFSGEMLEDAGLRDTNDLIDMVPDMLMSGEDAGRANICLLYTSPSPRDNR